MQTPLVVRKLKNPYRPILNLPKTRIEKSFNVIGGSIFLLSLVYAAINWATLPDRIPGHFNGLGEVERWGSKYEIMILPVIGFFIASLMTLLEKAPHMLNYPKRLNESNVEQFYIASRIVLSMTKNMCLVIFSFLIVQIIRVAKGEIQSLGGWLLPVFITMVFIPVMIGIYKNSRIKITMLFLRGDCHLQNYLFVFLGGMTGAFLRYLVQSLIPTYSMLWMVNVLGSFLLGCLNGVFKKKCHEGWRLFLTTGMLGSFTTFATFSESWFLIIVDNIILGLLFGLCMTSVCFIAALIGDRLVEGER